ncbi:uncharacterized protein LOC123227053 [Mangifera indica]|uniref:uncharacterized protein LOC123227053 n=1 Tax=Mangifera indica TaxID=29780 RepID=UPI001CF9AA6D|nr:uncharacterized protein LOC123227053 [Mangifera indica]
MIGNSVFNVLRRFLLQRQVSFLRSSQSQLKNTLFLPSKSFSSSASVFPNNPFTIIIFPSPPLRSPHSFSPERPLLIPRWPKGKNPEGSPGGEDISPAGSKKKDQMGEGRLDSSPKQLKLVEVSFPESREESLVVGSIYG